MKPFFSIIIPTFNQGDLLARCVKSVLNQSYKNYEIIIIDNNSSDNTSKIINKYKNLIIYKKINNQGVIARSRNLGIKLAKGKWISFLDSDDEWSKNKLKLTREKIKKKIDVICNDEWIISEKKIKVWSYGPDEIKFHKRLLKYGNVLSTSASTVKKEFLTKNKIKFNQNKKFVTAEDYEFFLNIAAKKGKFFFISQPLGYHYFHKKSASHNINKHKRAINEVLKYHSFHVQNFDLNKKKFFSICKNNSEFQNDFVRALLIKKITRMKVETESFPKNQNLSPKSIGAP